jgi:ribosomal protein S18 acetylase RimI-like enzyme
MQTDHLIPHQWETTRLIVRDSTLDDLPVLEQIDKAVAYIRDWTGWYPQDHPEDTTRAALTVGNLPPGGSKEFYRLQSIRLKANGEIIGYLEMYHGFPTPDIFYLVGLYLHPNVQGQRLGQEIMAELCQRVMQLNYLKMRLHVALKNWPALRFWTKAGFDKVIEIQGDKIHSEKTFAEIFLDKILT